jgi:hypothetical protein
MSASSAPKLDSEAGPDTPELRGDALAQVYERLDSRHSRGAGDNGQLAVSHL